MTNRYQNYLDPPQALTLTLQSLLELCQASSSGPVSRRIKTPEKHSLCQGTQLTGTPHSGQS